MRHGTRAHLTGLDLLFEIIHGDIHPEVAVKVDHDGIDTTHGIKDGAKPVIIGNLCRILLTLKSEFLADKGIAKLTPVILWIGHMVRIEITRSATELSCYRRIFQ